VLEVIDTYSVLKLGLIYTLNLPRHSCLNVIKLTLFAYNHAWTFRYLKDVDFWQIKFLYSYLCWNDNNTSVTQSDITQYHFYFWTTIWPYADVSSFISLVYTYFFKFGSKQYCSLNTWICSCHQSVLRNKGKVNKQLVTWSSSKDGVDRKSIC